MITLHPSVTMELSQHSWTAPQLRTFSWNGRIEVSTSKNIRRLRGEGSRVRYVPATPLN